MPRNLFTPKIRAWPGLYKSAWLGLCKCANICFYFCGLGARCWPQKSTHWLIPVQSKLHHNILMIYLEYTNILSQRMQVWWWPQKSLHPPISVPLIPICHSHWCSLWLKQICTPGRCLQGFLLTETIIHNWYWEGIFGVFCISILHDTDGQNG